MTLVGTESCLDIKVIAEEFNVKKGMVLQKYSFRTPKFVLRMNIVAKMNGIKYIKKDWDIF